LVAGRTIDLRSRIAGVALDVLAAARAGKLEFSHKFYRLWNLTVFILLDAGSQSAQGASKTRVVFI